jgi:predicted DNA-binding ribbon-helix-helix protein
MKSPVVKRSVVLAGHKTSVSLEDAFWQGLKDIATSRRMTVKDLINSIDFDREQGNLSSALRLFVLDHYKREPVVFSIRKSPVFAGRGLRTEGWGEGRLGNTFRPVCDP